MLKIITTPRILPRFPTISEMLLLKMTRIMVSFDVNSLFTNNSIINTLNIINIIKGYVNKNDRFTKKTVTPQGKFLDLVHLVWTNSWYTSDYHLYQQTDGPTDSLASKEIYIQVHNKLQYLRHYKHSKSLGAICWLRLFHS